MVKKIIAIYGNGGSYKTTFALALSRYIVGADPKADVVVVGADSTKPIIPLVAPQDKRFKGSIGNVLSAVSFEEDDLHKNLLMVDNRIGVLGYNIREMVRGSDTHVYWENLSIRFSEYQKQQLRNIALKIPPKVNRMSMVLLVVMLLLYVVVLGSTMFDSFGVLFA